MSCSTIFESGVFVETETKPCLTSFDSAQECSLAHFLEVYRLVEIENHEFDGCVFDETCLNVA